MTRQVGVSGGSSWRDAVVSEGSQKTQTRVASYQTGGKVLQLSCDGDLKCSIS